MLIAMLVAVLCAAPPLSCAEPPTVLDDLIGTWYGEGELFGQATEFEMTWERALGDRFVRLTYAIRGATRMDAVAHYGSGEASSVRGVWVDSRGEILELTATVGGTTLETIWTSPTERGRTIYEMKGRDQVVVRDYYHDGADWQAFGEALYTRVP